jgi:hypothetical protein
MAAYGGSCCLWGQFQSLSRPQGITLGAGVITWAWSPIKFQADMGILLTFMFLWNMLGALILIPALSHFLLRGAADAPDALSGSASFHARQAGGFSPTALPISWGAQSRGLRNHCPGFDLPSCWRSPWLILENPDGHFSACNSPSGPNAPLGIGLAGVDRSFCVRV